MKITDAYVRTYSDTGQVTAYVNWHDGHGYHARTEGKENSPHMQALLQRAEREGHPIRRETW